MTDREDDPSLFHHGLYERARDEIGTLRAKLPEDAFASLAREVIRRVSDNPVAARPQFDAPQRARIDALARALLDKGPQAGIEFIQSVRAQGASVETVYLGYLAEAARALGNWWEQDRISFVDVTIATGNIYAVMRGLKPLFRTVSATPATRSALFASVPGETHTLGIEMAADLFTKKGWDITLKRQMDHDEFIEQASLIGPPLIGLSAAGEHAIVPLARMIVALRISNPKAAIMVGGNVVNVASDLIETMGVEAMADDFDAAYAAANRLWEQQQAE
ncbi:B12-binding domain-containing protein [Sulfitobacter sp. S190]|uniref:cobalamin B12-binding domain-containing protein n=1 Tax=Sulfitobacter sp. S190 TaxID=2867022 RepID=UPI0021A8E041|nr:cobalamin-dependent protein [Sulfitobacter sp. S190]UWR24348.1 cobalamin-dependent protein [Sulfitobacter sp. S190]